MLNKGRSPEFNITSVLSEAWFGIWDTDTLYHGLATFTEVTFVNVHHAQMSTFVIEVYIWYIGFVLVFNWSLHC